MTEKKNFQFKLNDPWLTQGLAFSAMPVMSDCEDWELFQVRLRQSLKEIEEFLARTEESAEAVAPDKSLGRLSRMEAMQDQQLMLEARRRKKMQKVAVLSALQRIESGRYGTCMFCGNPIARERLEAAPEASVCMKCS